MQHSNPYILGSGNQLMYRSDGSLLDLDCSNLAGWADEDIGNGDSSQATFDSKSTFKFDTGIVSGVDVAKRTKSLGNVFGARIVASMNIYLDEWGLKANDDKTTITIAVTAGCRLLLYFDSAGAWIYDGATINEVGSGLTVLKTWQEWTFDIDMSAGDVNAECDVYLDRVLAVSSVDCSDTGVYTVGEVELAGRGDTTSNRITYIDWVKIGDGFM